MFGLVANKFTESRTVKKKVSRLDPDRIVGHVIVMITFQFPPAHRRGPPVPAAGRADRSAARSRPPLPIGPATHLIYHAMSIL